jgi:hypothetical protein
MQFDRRPMALPYPYGRRLEADHIHFSGRSPHQPTDVGLTMGNDLLKGDAKYHADRALTQSCGELLVVVTSSGEGTSTSVHPHHRKFHCIAECDH